MKTINFKTVFYTVLALSVLSLSSCKENDEEEETPQTTYIRNTSNADLLTVPTTGYWDGSDKTGTHTTEDVYGTNYDVYTTELNCAGALFTNVYYDDGVYPYWNNWGYSNTQNDTTEGIINQYAAYAGNASSGSNYFVAYGSENNICFVDSAKGVKPVSMKVTNNTYAGLSMLNGDMFAKKFGGDTGGDPDWFLLTIVGVDASGADADSVEFYLADYRSTDSAQDYIVKAWEEVDLSTLGLVKELKLKLSSSDVGMYGMNTPTYLCIDDLIFDVEE